MLVAPLLATPINAAANSALSREPVIRAESCVRNSPAAEI